MTNNETLPPRKRHDGTHQFDALMIGQRSVNGHTIEKIAEVETTSSATVTAFAIPVAVKTTVGVEATAVGREPGTGGNSYFRKIAGLFKRETGGDVTQVGSTIDGFLAANLSSGTVTAVSVSSGTVTGVSFSAYKAGEQVLVKVGGQDSHTMEWIVDVKYTKVHTST